MVAEHGVELRLPRRPAQHRERSGTPVDEVAPAGDRNLRVRKISGREVEVTWDATPADACFDSYGVFATGDPRLPNPLPTGGFRAGWVNVNDDDVDGLDQNLRWIGTSNLTFFLIVQVGPDGELGPVGHYGL